LWRQKKNPPIIYPPIGSGELHELFSAAIKLRHKALSEDCLVIGARKLIDPLYKYIEDERVREQAKDIHIRALRVVVVEIHRWILLILQKDIEGGRSRGLVDEMKAAVNEAAAYSITHSPAGPYGQLELAQYYRVLDEWESSEGRREFDGGSLQGLMWNWPTRDKTAKSGEGEFEDIFLCARCPLGASVPWDTEDIDF
jgi:hypothetical protein